MTPAIPEPLNAHAGFVLLLIIALVVVAVSIVLFAIVQRLMGWNDRRLTHALSETRRDMIDTLRELHSLRVAATAPREHTRNFQEVRGLFHDDTRTYSTEPNAPEPVAPPPPLPTPDGPRKIVL